MNTDTELDNSAQQRARIQVDLTTELDKLRHEKFHQGFPKSIQILEAVDDNADSEWEERLQQAVQDHKEECILLIPVYLGNFHWIGILLEFNENQIIQRAEFNDPLIDSKFVPKKIQETIAKFYPSVVLSSNSLQKHEDAKQSALLVIQNLLNSVEQSQLLHSAYRNTKDLQSKISMKHQNVTGLCEDHSVDSPESEPTIEKTLELQGNETKFNNFRNSSSMIRTDLKNETTLTPLRTLLPKEQQIENDETSAIGVQSKISENYFDGLSNQQKFTEHICTVTTNELASQTDNRSDLKACDLLKIQLREKLKKCEINDVKELDNDIIERKQEIENLVKQGKYKTAARRQESLVELEELQELIHKIRALETSQVVDLEKLKAALASGLLRYEIRDLEELQNEIMKRKQEIGTLVKREKTTTAAKRQESLVKLEELQQIADTIRAHSHQPTPPPTSEPTFLPVPEPTPAADTPDDSIAKKNVRNFYNDFSSMPACSEKSVLRLIFLISVKVVGAKVISENSIVVPDMIETEIENEFQCLNRRLKIEELDSTEIQNLMRTILINVKDENWKSAFSTLEKILKLIRPLNLPELLRLVKKVDDAAHLVNGKDIILLLGGTGSGKSTTIHFLGGSKMIEEKVNGLNHIAATEIKNPDLKKIITAPYAISVTRYISPVTLNLKDIGGSNKHVILCDSPGFEDTSGPEVDIANGIGIVKAMKGCKSVKPVVLISYKSIGDRCNGVKDLAHMLVGLIPGMRDYKKTFSYLFTKFPDKEKSTIKSLLKDVNDKLSEEDKSDTSFANFLNDMIKKTKAGARVIDPIHDDPLEIIEELIEGDAIEDSSEVFHFSITEKSKSIVQEQVRRHQLSIMSATKRSDYLLVQFKLDQLKYLKDLLHQDYIEQIYNDSVGFVSKHLSDEYQTATSGLNRCLIHQTAVSNEDIQQYQICIQHAQEAEVLRETHLGKEVVHSIAFIQYLNQLVDLMCNDLKDKDIDNLLVKTSLDKIKLLAIFFPIISISYNNTHRLFTEKIDLVVNSFKASVQSNQFNDSASNMTKLHDAFIILADHFDSKNLEATYKQTKEYFLKYLNDSVEKFNDSFDRQLDKNDIDNINECVCMFESINNTFTLHLHISKEESDEIYENLSSKIMNYFNTTVKKINTAFENKMELSSLEQLMDELDSIRTISTFDIKASELYFSTLEKLIGYINQSRLDVESLLFSLSRQEKIDINKFISCLMNIKNAKWIEKYRTDVYSDVMSNVEKQILEQIQELKDSVMQTNLDLDNSSKIKNVYKIIKQINEMKHLNKIFSDVDKHIDEVNQWFIKVTNDAFKIMKDTFNVEKWIERGYQVLDFNKAEKGFDYLYICKEIPILFQSDCMSTLNSLEEFIKYFSSFVHSEMDSNFLEIIEYQKENKDEIFKKARILAIRLQEISEIKTKYTNVFSKFLQQTLIEEWKTKLAAYLNLLTDDMISLSRTNRPDDLNSKLSIARALSILDCFMDDTKFIDVYREYQNILFTNTSDICRKAIEAITTNNYDLVVSEMTALQSSDKVGEHFFQQARRAINVGLSNLLEETRDKAIMLSRNIEKENITPILENLRRIKTAQQFITQYLDSPDDIDKCITDVKNMLTERIIRFIEGIKALIIVNNFSEADKKIDSIVLVRNLLGTYCTPEVSRQIHELKSSIDEVVLTDLVNKYSEMDIDKYTLNPPTDIFAKFGEASSSPIYHQAYNKIKEAIVAKFRKELDNAKTILSLSHDNIHIRKFESAINYLPQEMKQSLQFELDNCKGVIQQRIEANEDRINKVFLSDNLSSIKTILQEYKASNGMQFYYNQCRDRVLKSIQDIVANIKKSFEKSNIENALLKVKKLHEYRVEFQTLSVDIRQPCSEVRNQIKTVFSHAYLGFVHQFLESSLSALSKNIVSDDTVNLDSSTVKKGWLAWFRDSLDPSLKLNTTEREIVRTAENNLMCLIEFIKFHNENRDKDKDENEPHLIDLFPKDFNENLKTLNDKLVEYFTRREEQYKNALDELNVTSLKKILDASKLWDSSIIKMANDHIIHHITDDTMNNIAETIPNVTLFEGILESISLKLERLGGELINQVLINEKTEGRGKQRDEFYKKLNEKFTILYKAKVFSNYDISCDVITLERKCIESLESKIQEICSKAEEVMNKFIKDKKLNKSEYDSFDLHYNNMASFKNEMKYAVTKMSKTLENIKDEFFKRIQSWEDKIKSETASEVECANILILMKCAANNFPSFRNEIHKRIDGILDIFKNSRTNKTTFIKLYTLLSQDDNNIGKSIVAEHDAFLGYSFPLFNKNTSKHDTGYVLGQIKSQGINSVKLKNRYDKFYNIYCSLITQYLKPKIELNQLIVEIKAYAGDIKQKSNNIQWDGTVRDKVPKLTAQVLALWSLRNVHHYFEANSSENQKSYLFQPHAAQVISIFCMLGIGDTTEGQLSNNLVQIGTGEGKSMILGVTASILALLGFEVCCACYSDYLSQRDYTAFVKLFDSLGVLDYIHYGTANRLYEHVINENGDIRQVVEQLVLNDSNIATENAKITPRLRILLIDEVDVLFSRDFYGNIYTPTAILKEPTITSLINYIWTERKSQLNLNTVQKTQEYKNCCARFPKWVLLIQEATKDMLSDVNSFESHSYVIEEDKIGYIEQDNIAFNVVYGYKTLFAYYSEHENGKISKRSLEDNICLRIKCGSFSYAKIQLQFQYIMGVTGTFETLSEIENEIIEKLYIIDKRIIIPSIFDKNNLQFSKENDIIIENSGSYFDVIRRVIDEKLEKRAVFVFFESEKRLEEFYHSHALESIKDSVAFLTEEVLSTEKENLIKRATRSGQVTLFTRKFGRGTDFICYDPVISTNGGIHVIQTFLSEEASEEVQIKGRAARQGEYGSYSMVLLYDDLQKFLIVENDVKNAANSKSIITRLLGSTYTSVYDLLNAKRTIFFKLQYEATYKCIVEAKTRHDVSQRFLVNLKLGRIDDVRKFLIEENKGVERIPSSRTICLMSATSSMSHLLHNCKNTVETIFQRTTEILRKHNIDEDSFQIQFVVYRNYCCAKDKLIQSSPWETKADNLRAFMNTINVAGGVGNEAIEIGLLHSNRENERKNITQVILIGDAPPNANSEVVQKRSHCEEAYWKTTKFAEKTYYQSELMKLISKKIPVHAFFVEKRAQAVFKDIATKTGGRCEQLDINSPKGADMLTNLVTEVILENVGGDSKGNALVKAYKTRF